MGSLFFFGAFLKVAVVRFSSFALHIFPPQSHESHERPNFSHAVVMYEQKDPGDCKPMAGVSGESFPMLIVEQECYAWMVYFSFYFG